MIGYHKKRKKFWAQCTNFALYPHGMRNGVNTKPS